MHTNVFDAVHHHLSNSVHVSASAELQLSAHVWLGESVCASLGAGFDFMVVIKPLQGLSAIRRGLFSCLTVPAQVNPILQRSDAAMKSKVVGLLAAMACFGVAAPFALASDHKACHMEKVQTGWQVVKHVVLTDHGPVAVFNASPTYQIKTVC